MPVKRALFLVGAALAACSSTPISSSFGNFAGPSGLAVAQAGDRDLLFITSTATDELRVLQMCTAPFLADGGVDPANTCPTKEDFQFLPGPLRLFPATVPAGDRPVRVAGTRLLRPDGSKSGVALVAGADSALAVVDARNLVEAMYHTAAPRPPFFMPLDSPPIDVVAAAAINPATNLDLSAPAVRAFVATRGATGQPGQLLVLDVRLDASGSAQMPTVQQRCALDNVLPRRLALVPGRDDVIYVADGAGDGAIQIAVAGIPAAALPLQSCGGARILAGGPTRSLALNPQWYEPGQPTHPAGEVAMMVRDDGGVVFSRTSDGQIVPVPPFDFHGPGPQAMEPIVIGLGAREVTFLRSVRPNTADPNACQNAPCTPLFVGDALTGKPQKFNLLAVIAATDGATYFVDVPGRRIVNVYYFANQPALQPILSAAAVLSPSSTATTNPPSLTFGAADPTVAGHQNQGWFNAGVTRASRWRIIWHAPIPGLEKRGGTITRTASGTLRFATQPADLNRWVQDTAIHLGPGDVLSFSAYFPPASGCDDIASETPGRFELPIVKIAADGSSLELATLPDTATTRGFHPTCPKFGAVAEFRSVGDHPWTVVENITVMGRAKTGELFVAKEPRFDYPLDYDPKLPPLIAADIALAFTLGGTEPTLAGSFWNFATTTGQAPVVVRDTNSPQGIATQVIQYSSPKITNLLFTTLTGSNTILQAAPDLLTVKGGVLAYR
jgi:hypothetical protein